MQRWRWVGVWILAVVLLGWTRPAAAQTRTFRFDGVVTSVSDTGGALGGSITTSMPFSVIHTFDLATPDLNPGDPTAGTYGQNSAGVGLSLVVGGHTFASRTSENPDYFLEVLDNYSHFGNTFDQFQLVMNRPTSTISGITISQFILALNSPDLSVFQSEAIPDGPLDLSRFSSKMMYMSGQRSSDAAFFQFSGVIGSTSEVPAAEAVPEPSAALLFLPALAVVGWVRRSRRG